MTIELNESEFDEFIRSNRVAIIDCWAPWCGPCRRMSAVIDELSTDFTGKIAIAKLNTDENQAISVRFGINAIPTLLIFNNNVLVESLVGLRPKEDIIAHIDKLI